MEKNKMAEYILIILLFLFVIGLVLERCLITF
nr:MAG TPA: protein of unknown function (DUF4719) [Caudoviricetes sp.]